MYRNSYQRGMLTVFYSVGSKPLSIWDTHVQDGVISRFLDQDIKSMVLEIRGTNVSTTYITCPKGNGILGITMPFLVMIVKNLKKYFSFEVTILDETGTRRRFRVSNFQSSTQILPLCTVMPIGLSDGWNQIQFNLAEFTRRAYKKQYVEAQKLKINANICLRRIYFCERLVPDDELPPEYKLFFPLTSKVAKERKGVDKENVITSTSQKNNETSHMLSEQTMDTKLEVIKSSKTSFYSTKSKVVAGSRRTSKSQIEAVPEEVSNIGSMKSKPIRESIKSFKSEMGEQTDATSLKSGVVEKKSSTRTIVSSNIKTRIRESGTKLGEEILKTSTELGVELAKEKARQDPDIVNEKSPGLDDGEAAIETI